MATQLNTVIAFKHTAEVYEFFKKQAAKQRRSFPDYMRITLEDLKTQIEQQESGRHQRRLPPDILADQVSG